MRYLLEVMNELTLVVAVAMTCVKVTAHLFVYAINNLKVNSNARSSDD